MATATMDIETRLREEAEQKESRLYEIIGKRDYLIEELQEENAALRVRLDGLLKQQQQQQRVNVPDQLTAKPQTSAVQGATPDDTCPQKSSECDCDALNRQYAELDRRFKTLEALHCGCESKISTLDAKCKDYKERARGWYRYIERQKRGGKKTRSRSPGVLETAKVGVRDSPEREGPRDDMDTTPRARVDKPAALPARVARVLEHQYRRSPSLQLCPSPMQSSFPAEMHEQERMPELRISSSQTTVEATQQITHATEEAVHSSDDEPELISERCLKRKAPRRARRSSPARRVKLETCSANSAVELSSDTAGINELSAMPQLQAMCSDLDYVPVPLPSSRIQQKDNPRQRAVSEDHARPTTQLQRSRSSLSEGDCRPHTSMGVACNPGPVKPATESVTESANLVTPAVLQSISVNVPRAKQTPNKSTPRHGRAGKRGKISGLSEDGDDSSQVNAPLRDAEVPPLPKDATLDGLLMGQPTSITPNVSRPAALHTRNVLTRTPAQLRTPMSAMKPLSPSKRPMVTAVPQGIEAPPASFLPEDEPLRLRDVRELKLDDFKINAGYLGSDFAFADTLRGRDDRRALHTCNKPECCSGALQKAILMGGQKLSGKTDAEVLGEYLGPQYKQLMASYGTTKQRETVLQAHATAFAKQHGKHRQAFERQSTPPGFWRTDFPTTQENLEDRRKARENERLLVEARYREAMREGGQWVFRDE